MTTGCQTWRIGRWAADASVNQGSTSPSQFVGHEQDETVLVDAAEPGRADEARAQILAFINRLKNLPHPDASDTTPPEIKVALETDVAQKKEDVPRRLSERPKQAVSTSAVPTSSHQEFTGQSIAASESHPIQEDFPHRATPPRILEVSIRQPSKMQSNPQAESEEDSVTPLANRPLTTNTPEPMPGALDTMIGALERRITATPNDVEARWRLALLDLALGRESRVSDVSSEMSEESALMLRRAVDVMDSTRQVLEDPVEGVADAMTAVEALRAVLRKRAELTIPTIALCSRVQAFGVYQELPDDIFRAYTPNQVIVYFEIKHFTSERTTEGRFRTLISDHFEVLTLDGETLWQQDEPSIEDISRTRREDFFVAKRVVLPPRLREGRYVFKVTVEDLLAGKRTQAIHEFSVGSDETTSSRR